MDKIIIGIHGLGNKPDKKTLEKWWLEAICEGLKNINKLQLMPKFELVYWADILFDKPLDETITDEDNPYFLDEKYLPAPKNFVAPDTTSRKKFLNFLEKQMDKIFLNDDLTSNYSFISNLIFKKYFTELDAYYNAEKSENPNVELTKDKIRNRLTAVLHKHKEKKILLIAHSMGSIIAYDVLSLVATNININTFVTMGSPLGIPIIISKVGEELKQINPNLHKLSTPNNVTKRWVNYSDLEDSVALNYNLNDDYNKNINEIAVEDIIVTNNYTVGEERNPHKSFGYLRAPQFSRLLYKFLVEDKNIFEIIEIKTKYILGNLIKKIRGFVNE